MKSLGQRLGSSLSYANVMATMGVFLALAGTAVAVTKAPKNSVVSASIKNGAVNSADIKDNAVKGADVDESSLSLPSFSVANNSLGGEHVKDGSLSGADLQNGSVGGADIQDGSVGGADIQDGSVNGSDVQDNSLTGADVQSLTGADVQDDSLAGADVDESSLGQVPAATLGGKAALASETAICDPDGTIDPCVTVTLNIPAPGGKVLVIGDAVTSPGTDGAGDCQLSSTAGVIVGSQASFASNAGESGNSRTLIGVTGQLAPGTYAFGLDCRESSGNLTLRQSRVLAVALSGS